MVLGNGLDAVMSRSIDVNTRNQVVHTMKKAIPVTACEDP
jgi:hypothetical protein